MSEIIKKDLLFKQSTVKYSIKHSNNAKAALKRNLTREFVRFWRTRRNILYDENKFLH